MENENWLEKLNRIGESWVPNTAETRAVYKKQLQKVMLIVMQHYVGIPGYATEAKYYSNQLSGDVSGVGTSKDAVFNTYRKLRAKNPEKKLANPESAIYRDCNLAEDATLYFFEHYLPKYDPNIIPLGKYVIIYVEYYALKEIMRQFRKANTDIVNTENEFGEKVLVNVLIESLDAPAGVGEEAGPSKYDYTPDRRDTPEEIVRKESSSILPTLIAQSINFLHAKARASAADRYKYYKMWFAEQLAYYLREENLSVRNRKDAWHALDPDYLNSFLQTPVIESTLPLLREIPLKRNRDFEIYAGAPDSPLEWRLSASKKTKIHLHWLYAAVPSKYIEQTGMFSGKSLKDKISDERDSYTNDFMNRLIEAQREN